MWLLWQSCCAEPAVRADVSTAAAECLKSKFRSSATGAAIRLDSLRISGVGAPGDSAIIGVATSTSFVNLPLKSDSHLTAWCISYKQKALDYPQLNDTLTFEYDTTPYFVSDDCGVGSGTISIT